jgi:hypothetical protein
MTVYNCKSAAVFTLALVYVHPKNSINPFNPGSSTQRQNFPANTNLYFIPLFLQA